MESIAKHTQFLMIYIFISNMKLVKLMASLFSKHNFMMSILTIKATQSCYECIVRLIKCMKQTANTASKMVFSDRCS